MATPYSRKLIEKPSIEMNIWIKSKPTKSGRRVIMGKLTHAHLFIVGEMKKTSTEVQKPYLSLDEEESNWHCKRLCEKLGVKE